MMFKLTKTRLAQVNRIRKFDTILLHAAGLLIFGGWFSSGLIAQTSAPAAEKQSFASQTANQVKAEKLMEEASALGKENTNPSKRLAINKYKQAAALLRNNQEPRDFIVLGNIAFLYKELKEPARALIYWQQALRSLRTVKNRNPKLTEAEGVTLLQIGAVHDERGDREKALEFYRQALNLTRANKGYAAAGALNGIVKLHIKAKQPERAAAFLEQEITRARAAGDAEMEKGLSEILNEIKNGTFKD